ncbi:MAG: helix-turn-helix transcriptional regulator [Okeania sp. SIO2H7]|nr:helix-turn-helix transcriptional regulator [Okeania sp. SIO2H7]
MKKIIKAARHKKKLTQKQLGKIIGYDETYISKLENGNKGFCPESDAIAAIVKH